MQFNTTYTQEKTVNVDLPLFLLYQPCDGVMDYLAMIQPGIAIEAYISNGFTTVNTSTAPSKIDDVVKGFLKAEEDSEKWSIITEEEFLTAHQKALESLSLRPVLTNELKDDLPSDLYTKGVHETEREIVEEIDKKSFS